VIVPPYCGAPVAIGVTVVVEVVVTVVADVDVVVTVVADVEVVVTVVADVEVGVEVEVEVDLLQDASSMAVTTNKLNPNQTTLFFTFVLLFLMILCVFLR